MLEVLKTVHSQWPLSKMAKDCSESSRFALHIHTVIDTLAVTEEVEKTCLNSHRRNAPS